MRKRTAADSLRPNRCDASSGPRRPRTVPDRPGDRDGRSRQRPYSGARIANAGDARWGPWPEPLPALFRARLAESFQNAGLGRWIDGPAANANYEVDLDIRSFELDVQTKEIHVDIAAWIVSLGSGRITANQIFSLRIPVESTDAAHVAAAMDQAASSVMTDIVAFVARKL